MLDIVKNENRYDTFTTARCLIYSNIHIQI